MSVEVGQQAPDFTLKDENGNDVTLSALRGKKNAVLIFYFSAFSGICTKELQELQGPAGEAANKDAEIFLISCDSRFVLRAFKEQQGFHQTMLSDWWPHGEVAKRYGVFDEKAGGARRATFVLDTTGTVLYKRVNEIPQGRTADDYVQALAACPLPGSRPS